MAKRFHFDDEEDIEKDDYVDSQEELFQEEDDSLIEDTYQEDNQSMVKKKKKFVWKWWHYLIIFFVALVIAFSVYIFMASNNGGPVYGTRCDGLVSIPVDNIKSAEDIMKQTYSEIQSIDMEIECRELRVDITFKDGMSTKKAQTIAEKAVQTLDELVGQPKEDGKTYSQLFGTINGETQYEVDVFMVSENSEDFPMYGIKHTSKDDFSYTLASIKDKESYNAARDTLEKNAEN